MNPAHRLICVVGSANHDQITRTPRLPRPGETVTGADYQTGFGGKGSNQAVMAARLGAVVTMVAKLGRDAIGQATLENYRAHGIDSRFVVFDEHRPSGVAPIWVDENTGQNSIIVVPGANAALTAEEVRRAESVLRQAAVVVCQNEVPLEANLEAFRIAREGGRTLTIYNPAPALAAPAELLRLTDLLVPNQHEAELLSGGAVGTDAEIAAAAARLRDLGPRAVIITLGARGACVLDDEGLDFLSAPRVEAVDTTGAGDALVGSLAHLLALGLPLREALRRACAIATRSVLRHGTQTSFPTAAEVAELLVWPNPPGTGRSVSEPS